MRDHSHLAAPLRLSDAPRSVLTLALRYLGRLAARGWGKPMQSQFRTIQAYPKDGRYLSGQAWRAVCWHSGFREGAHGPGDKAPI
jgi:hypothetical protein